ncbi:hypothetical protein THRCLA_08440 [Thraustotheca clavata]|uniref:FYVE-type domain-containing protein n=1 Tax=Thraustotheca clavata TaxID=74557 RepID=A0A1V9Z631_9STRA|nr:hypothetical protein THRCLA_08440 [Thraustotheca clavata]
MLRVSSYDAPFTSDDERFLHEQGEKAMVDLVWYDQTRIYRGLSDKDHCTMAECQDDQLYTVKGSLTVYTHLAEVLDLLNTRPRDFSYVLSRLLGGIHAINRILHPKATQKDHNASMQPSEDEHAMLVTWLAINAAANANNDHVSAAQLSPWKAPSSKLPAISREYCFLRYSGYFNTSPDSNVIHRVMPDEPLSPLSIAVSVWNSIDFQPVYINASIGRFVRSGFILQHTKAPNAVKVNFILSAEVPNNGRIADSDKVLLQRIVRSTLLNMPPSVMELRLFKDQILHKSAWSDGNMCTICLKNFNFVRRKHHCRLCGDVFCNTCSIGRNRREIGDNIRVCASCIEGNPSSTFTSVIILKLLVGMIRASDKLFSMTNRLATHPRNGAFRKQTSWQSPDVVPDDAPLAPSRKSIPFDIPPYTAPNMFSSNLNLPDRMWTSQPGRQKDYPEANHFDLLRKQSLPESRRLSVSAKEIPEARSYNPNERLVSIDPVFAMQTKQRFDTELPREPKITRPTPIPVENQTWYAPLAPLHLEIDGTIKATMAPRSTSNHTPQHTATDTQELSPDNNHSPSPWLHDSISSPVPEIKQSEDDTFIYESTGFAYPLSFRNGNPWPDAPMTSTEHERLEKAKALDLLRRRDDMLMYVKIACKTMACPIGTLCIVGGSAGLLIAKVGGVAMDTLPRHVMLESHAIMSSEPTIILSCKDDLRFVMNPLVESFSEEPGVQFYVGIPLRTSDNITLGILSLMDIQPRQRVRKSDIKSLIQVADTIMARIQDAAAASPPEPVYGRVELDID